MHTTARILLVSLVALAGCSRSAAVAPTMTPMVAHVAPPTTTHAQLAAHRDQLRAQMRLQLIEWLGEYAEAATYPTDANGWPLSVFRDANGVRCPMAELIYRSGHAELVEAVVASNNALRLADVQDGPLAAWMAESGLTRDEIIMVQGAANIPMMVDSRSLDQVQIATATGRVHGRLDTAAVALRDHTPDSLAALAAPATLDRDHTTARR